MNLNFQQQKAVSQINWPILILAWAWSWKTATLVKRIENMIEKWIAPNSILAVTFTNKARFEMKERVWKVLNVEYNINPYKNKNLPTIWTFHSVWLQILKEVTNNENNFNGIPSLEKDFLIYDETDKNRVLKSIIKDDLKLDEKKYSSNMIWSFISNAKNAWIDALKYEKYVDSYIKEVVKEIYLLYEKRLKENNAIDFDDILLKTFEVLKDEKNLCYYQNKWTYIMIDEYQDTNQIQYYIVKALASKNRNLCVVWDDWQSIYSWRWANMQNILNFKKDYPDAVVIKLEQNYRSTQNIVNAANKLIKNNKTALDKTLFTENEVWEKIIYINAPNDRIEAFTIAKIIKEKWNNYFQNLILYRTNAQSRLLEEALIYENIPYKIVWWLKFYDRKEVKDIIYYLKAILNPNDILSIKRIINIPSRKIWDATFAKIMDYKNNYNLWVYSIIQNIFEVDELSNQSKKAVNNFYLILSDLIEKSYTLNVFDLINYVIDKINYKNYLIENFKKEEYEVRFENLDELKNVASNYIWIEPRDSLSLFLEEVSLLTDLQDKDEIQNVVTLMTIHNSKWLEYDRVFITWLEEWIFPSSKSFWDIKELEEERRLMYVALTRAKKELFLSRASERFYFWNYLTNPESRFLKEIDRELIEEYQFETKSFFENINLNNFSCVDIGDNNIFKIKKNIIQNDVLNFSVWNEVIHPKFWNWIIISISWDIADIKFKEWIKKMNIKIAPIKKV